MVRAGFLLSRPWAVLSPIAFDLCSPNRIAHDVLGRTLDELPPQTRRLLTLLVDWVRHECEARDETREALRFTRREVRTATRWGDTQLKIHLSRLVALEYVIAHRGRNGLFEYELLYSGEDDGKAHLCGLIDPTAIAEDGTRSGPDEDQSGPRRGPVGPWSVIGRRLLKSRKVMQHKAKRPIRSGLGQVRLTMTAASSL